LLISQSEESLAEEFGAIKLRVEEIKITKLIAPITSTQFGPILEFHHHPPLREIR
jgi:hypothetical protein